MLSALQFAGYDVRHEWGDGEHNSRHATAIFPDVLRWLWRDWPSPIKANPEGNSKQDVYQTLVAGEDWQLVSEGHRHTDGPAVNAKGELFFSDPGEQPDPQGRTRRKNHGVRREHERRKRHDVRPRRPALCRRDAHQADRRLRSDQGLHR